MSQKIISIVFTMLIALFANAQDSTKIKNLEKELADLRIVSQRALEKLEKVQEGLNYGLDEKIGFIQTNIPTIANTIEMLEAKTAFLHNNLKSNQRSVFFTAINNPQNNTLGYKFSDKLLDLVKTTLKVNNKSLFKRIVGTVENITNNPLIKSIPALGSVFNLTNNTLTIIKSTSILKDDIDNNSITNLEAAILKELQFYEQLNNTTIEFKLTINRQTAELTSLQLKTIELTQFFLKTLSISHLQQKAIKENGDDESNTKYLSYLCELFNERNIKDSLDSLRDKSLFVTSKSTERQLNREKYYASLSNYRTINNKSDEVIALCREFIKLVDEYVSASKAQDKGVRDAFKFAVDSGLDRGGAAGQVKELDKIIADKSFEEAIKVDKLRKQTYSISKTVLL